MSINVTPAQSGEGEWLLGIWLRDGLSGLGTLTFCDPDSGVFGALGHSVSDSDTGLTIPVREGSITDAQIVSVNPGVSGSPGELNGCADLGKVLGSIRNREHRAGNIRAGGLCVDGWTDDGDGQHRGRAGVDSLGLR